MSDFAKRHYEAIALAFQASCPQPHWNANKRAQWQVTRDAIAETFARDNYAFSKTRFQEACEPGANVRSRTSNPPTRDLIWPRRWVNVGSERKPEWKEAE